MKFIEQSDEYAKDIELFANYWKNDIGNISVIEAISILEEKIKEAEIFNNCSDTKCSSTYFWDKARKKVFYEDVKFVLASLKKLKERERLVFIQCPDYPNKVVREKKLAKLIFEKYSFFRYKI